MNAEQLNTVAKMVINDVQETRILRFFSRLSNNLNELTNNPGDEGAQRNVQTSWSELVDALKMLEEKRWPVGYQQTIRDLGGEILVSNQIVSQIENSLRTEALTPATIRDRVDEMQKELTTFVSKLETLRTAFDDLGIGEEELEAGEVELGFLIPREHIENRLDDFAREVRDFDNALKLISVVAIGTREEFEITYISASDLKIFLRTSLLTASITAAVVSFIIDTLNGIADLKLKYGQIEELGVNGTPLQELENFIEGKLLNDLESFLPELVDEFCSDMNDHDKQENCNRLRKAVTFLAPRLERGYVIEMRVEPLSESEDDDDSEYEADIEGRPKDRGLVNKLSLAAQQLKSIRPIGEPILELKKPDWSSTGDADDSGE